MMLSILSTSLLTILAVTTAPVADDGIVAAQLPFYPLQTCLVSGEELGGMGDSIDFVSQGRLVRFCCKGCIKDFNADPETFLGKLDEAVLATQGPSYPLEVCVVSGEALGDAMGDPVDMVYEGRLVRLCCNGCRKDFAKSPDSFLAKIDAALIEEQTPDYPLQSCPVSGEPLLEGEIVDMLYGTQLIRLCCPACEKKVLANPQPVLDVLAQATAGHEGEHAGGGVHDGHDGHDAAGQDNH